MNKYFGKTSQKLIIAGIVVCACAAQVFRIEAVQDFFLYDVAQALIGRPLTRPHVYRVFLSGLSVFIPAAAFIVFGFLYSMATFPKVSGYFKDTARELKDFFHERNVFNRRNGYILLAVFAVTFIGYFALIRGDSGYRDDLYRQNSGTFGWLARYGRVITETVNLAIHGAYSIHDRSPLGQIIAMGVLSVAALVMSLAFSGFLVMGGADS